MKKLPIGESDFRRLREKDCYFVDKSEFIADILNENNDVILIPRPRRFGKTLNLSMLRYFFDIDENARDLFNGLKIETLPEIKHQGKYPVIFITFKDLKEPNFDIFLKKLSKLITSLYEFYSDKLVKGNFSQLEKKGIERILAGDTDYTLLQGSLEDLSKYLYKVYNQKPIILLDEYDTPIHAAWIKGYYEELIDFMRGFMSAAFKDNPNFKKAVITGCLRVSKESIFTGLNNLTVASILTHLFDKYFGFTKEETLKLLKDYKEEHRYDEIIDWYDGYKFGTQIMLNPWSVLNTVSYKELRPYWANTSSNDVIRMLVEEGPNQLKEDITRLLNGESIVSYIDENIVFPDLKYDEKSIYSLLFFSGYLRCENKENIKGKIRCELVIPNIEVEYIYENIISNWVKKGFSGERLNQLLKALIDKNIDEFELILNDLVVETLSYFDAKGKEPEALYLGFIAGMLIGLEPDYRVKTNRESGYGRYDVMVIPKDVKKTAIVMELKSLNKTKHKDPDKAIEEALKQIEEKGYVKELEELGCRDILKLAVVSDGKKVWVKEG